MGLTVNGILGGLVGITAGCATIDPWASIVVGGVAAIVVILGVKFIDSLKIDDPVGAVSVHGLAGIWGVLAVGLLSSQDGVASAGYADPEKYGLLLGGGFEQIGIQALGIASIVGWTAVTAGVLFAVIRLTMGLRVSEEEEIRGMDLLEHGIDAYPDWGASGQGIFAPVEVNEAAQSAAARARITHGASELGS
jgi:Amt family ammonium transporter